MHIIIVGLLRAKGITLLPRHVNWQWQNDIHKKVVKTATDLRYNDDCDYKESIDAAIAKRKFLLDRLIKEEDLMDEESDTDVWETYNHHMVIDCLTISSLDLWKVSFSKRKCRDNL